jgi:hypothetical protein
MFEGGHAEFLAKNESHVFRRTKSRRLGHIPHGQVRFPKQFLGPFKMDAPHLLGRRPAQDLHEPPFPKTAR